MSGTEIALVVFSVGALCAVALAVRAWTNKNAVVRFRYPPETRPPGTPATRKKWQAWTKEEVRALKRGIAEGKSYTELARTTLPGRRAGCISNKARELGAPMRRDKINPFTQEEIEFLRANCDRMTRKELAAALGRKRGSVDGKINYLGLTTKPDKPGRKAGLKVAA